MTSGLLSGAHHQIGTGPVGSGNESESYTRKHHQRDRKMEGGMGDVTVGRREFMLALTVYILLADCGIYKGQYV